MNRLAENRRDYSFTDLQGGTMNWTSGSVSATMRAEKTVPCLPAQCAQKEGC